MRQHRRSLTNVGGPTDLQGDPVEARKLARCFSIRPAERLPFTHGFHPYPARMHPEIAQRAVELYAPQGMIVDPFVGSGTVALEAVRAGLPFAGSDISRVALEIAWARTRVMPPAECRKVEEEGELLSRRAAREPERPLAAWARGEEAWYAPHTLREICALKTAIDAVEAPVTRRLLACVLSSIVVKVSRQVSDSATVIDERARPWPAGTTFRFFSERCSELTRQLLALSSDLHKRKVAFIDPGLRLEDARTASWPAPIGLVLTSPPYAGTYDYALHHARRLPLLDGDQRILTGGEIGSRSRVNDQPRGLEDYRADLTEVAKRLAGSLAPTGRMLWLIGDGIASGKPMPADRLMNDVARGAGLRVVASVSQERADWSFARRGQGRREHLICLRSGPR